jgi:peptide/nickel transport system substrate-binding protein
MLRRLLLGLIVASLIGAACGAPSAERGGAGSVRPTGAGEPAPRTLVIVHRQEPLSLYDKVVGAGSQGFVSELFNAYLALRDNTGAPHPYLAERLPQLNTESWQVFPDGRMETTYRLRPGLTWHDGAPLTAEDFVFALRVYASPHLKIFAPAPQDLVEEMLADGPDTLRIRWRSPYADAGALAHLTLGPLPRHLLEQPYLAVERDPTAADAFVNHPFWTSQYVGAGPYQLVRWDRAVEVEGTAFAGHAHGQPKIHRVLYRFMEDENTILANVLAGEVHYTAGTLRAEQLGVLKREWVSANKGRLLPEDYTTVATQVQFRPEYQKSLPLLDLRVRKALAHLTDSEAVLLALSDGEGRVPETFASPNERLFPVIDRAVTKHPFDPRRAEQFLTEAGLTKDRDGFFTDTRATRLAPEYRVLQGDEYERAGQVVVDVMRRHGIDTELSVLPNNLIRNNEVRHQFPGLAMGGRQTLQISLATYTTSWIGTPANRWTGQNRGGWSDLEYDRLVETTSTALDPAVRDRALVQALVRLSEDVPAVPVFHGVMVGVVAGALSGPQVRAPDTSSYWNVQAWELR